MRRAVLVVGAASGVLLAGLPALAGADPRAPAGAEREAVAVLSRAAQAGRALAYTGTQYVATWHDRASAAQLAQVDHVPGHAAVVTPAPTAAGTGAPLTATAALDPRLVELVAASYDLAVVGDGRCAGRETAVVEARRGEHVAGRFWVDRASGLLLRREVYDDGGRRVRSSAFVDLDVRPAAAAGAASAAGSTPAPVAATAAALRADGWPVADRLPGGLRLYDAGWSGTGERVVHLAYSDGLSTLSLFVQRGRLGTRPVEGFTAEQVGERPVWVQRRVPERVVWSGEGRVWTLVSDAPEAAVRAAVAALPRDPAPREGVLARLGRGLSRLGSLLNPFG